MKNLFLTATLLITCIVTIIAQNPYESLKVPEKVLSIGNGQFEEIHQNKATNVIGKVIIDRETGTISAYGTTETRYSEATMEPEITTRFLSNDPLAKEYPEQSPYNFVKNSPILLVDNDGRKVTVAGDIAQGMADMRSMLPATHQSALVMTNSGFLAWDMSKIAADQHGVLNMTDPGVSLIDGLITSQQTYRLTVSVEAKTRTAANFIHNPRTIHDNEFVKAGELLNKPVKTTDLLTTNANSVIAARTVKGIDPDSYTRYQKTYQVPADPTIDAEFTIVPVEYFTVIRQDGTDKPRTPFVMHEMQEMFTRQEENIPRTYSDPARAGQGAHPRSIATSKTLKKTDNRRDVGNEGAIGNQF